MAGKVVLATAGYDHVIKFWEASSGTAVRSVPYTDSLVNRLCLTPDKAVLAVAGNPNVRFFDVQSNNPAPVTSFDGHTNNVTGLGFQKEGKWMFTCSEDGSVKIWDVRATGCQRDYACGSAVNAIALHPNQAELICVLQNGMVRVLDLAENKCSREQLAGGKEIPLRAVSIAPDATQVVVADNEGKCHFWRLAAEDTSKFEPLTPLTAHKTYILKTLFSPDAKLLATTSADKTIKIWSAKDHQLLKTLSGHSRWVWDCAFSSDSGYLVSGSSDCVARLWELGSGETIRHYTGHSRAVSALALADY